MAHHSETEFARSARWALDDDLNKVSPARAQRLAQASAAQEPAASHLTQRRLATLLNKLQSSRFGRASAQLGAPRFWSIFAGLTLLCGLIWIHDMTLHQHIHDTADIDAMMLTDELPLGAWLEEGFHSFLHLLDEE